MVGTEFEKKNNNNINATLYTIAGVSYNLRDVFCSRYYKQNKPREFGTAGRDDARIIIARPVVYGTCLTAAAYYSCSIPRSW